MYLVFTTNWEHNKKKKRKKKRLQFKSYLKLNNNLTLWVRLDLIMQYLRDDRTVFLTEEA